MSSTFILYFLINFYFLVNQNDDSINCLFESICNKKLNNLILYRERERKKEREREKF